ncbi:MAG: DegV family protein [Firmicutes bacterium]|nr:DegV family protein [Bacillota bacterium]
MRDYVILTDSSCDLSQEMADELGVVVAPLTVMIDGNSYRNYLDGREIAFQEFYSKLRAGKQGSTSAVNVDEFCSAMRGPLQEGKDILYLGFSSGLSATYQSGTLAAEDMRSEYPEATILAVDTLSASMGQGLLVYLAVQEKRKGMTIQELRDYVEGIKLSIAHWFTVDDLNHLKRGGRISAAAALLGSTLNIKPILHVDNEGHLISVGKVRGRRQSIKKLLEEMSANGVDFAEQTVFISHGDALEDAELLADMIRESLSVKEVVINYIGPVIGAHSGPGTIALFFLAKGR